MKYRVELTIEIADTKPKPDITVILDKMIRFLDRQGLHVPEGRIDLIHVDESGS